MGSQIISLKKKLMVQITCYTWMVSIVYSGPWVAKITYYGHPKFQFFSLMIQIKFVGHKKPKSFINSNVKPRSFPFLKQFIVVNDKLKKGNSKFFFLPIQRHCIMFPFYQKFIPIFNMKLIEFSFKIFLQLVKPWCPLHLTTLVIQATLEGRIIHTFL